jgi:hypothetical protein
VFGIVSVHNARENISIAARSFLPSFGEKPWSGTECKRASSSNAHKFDGNFCATDFDTNFTNPEPSPGPGCAQRRV